MNQLAPPSVIVRMVLILSACVQAVWILLHPTSFEAHARRAVRQPQYEAND